MSPSAAPHPSLPLGSVVGGTLVGASLVVLGLGMAYLTVATPLVASLLPQGRATSSQVAFGIWSFALIAGGALLVAGTNRLAIIVARIRSRGSDRSTMARALRDLPTDVVVATGVVPNDGSAVPALAIGAFGVAVLHELPARDRLRLVDGYWEARTSHGWTPTEGPLERATRDADRVRRWLGQGDLDFVVRVHAALIATDASVARSATCAVLNPAQVQPWIAALPSQRTLTTARRNRLQALVTAAVPGHGQRRGRKGR